MIALKSAPRWLSVAYVLHGAMFILPILMLFYGYKGLTIGDFFFIEGIAELFIFALEIPTGYIGDLFSRKQTLIMGTLAWIMGYFILIFGPGFWSVLMGELVFSTAIAFISGTLEAYLYDLLKKQHKEDVFHKKYAKMKMLENLSLTIATFTGAFIYQFLGPTMPLWFGIFCLLASAVILFLLPDVPESRRIVAKEKSKIQDILDISKYAMKHPEIKWLMVFPGVFGSLTLIFYWGLQSVMVAKHIPVLMFSLIVGGNALVRTFFSGISGKILEKIQLSGIIKLQGGIIVMATLAACVAVYLPVWAVYVCLVFMIVGSSSVVLSEIATSVLVNHRIKSDERATVLSIKSMVGRIFQGFCLICLKPLFDGIGVGPTFMISSLLLIPILICAQHLYHMKLKTRG